MRFDQFREQMRAISQGRTIQELDEAQSILLQMIDIALAEPNWRNRAVEIFVHWFDVYPEQMPRLLEIAWQVKEDNMLSYRQQQEQRAKTAVVRKKELTQDIEKSSLIMTIQNLQSDPRHTAMVHVNEAKVIVERKQTAVATKETALATQIMRLKEAVS